jgi:hypothetical protein
VSTTSPPSRRSCCHSLATLVLLVGVVSLLGCRRLVRRNPAALPAVSAVGGLGPVLQIKAPAYDFGTIVQRIVVLHSFEIQNVGSAQLQLAAENQALGCVARAEPPVLAPSAIGPTLVVNPSSMDR